MTREAPFMECPRCGGFARRADLEPSHAGLFRGRERASCDSCGWSGRVRELDP